MYYKRILLFSCSLIFCSCLNGLEFDQLGCLKINFLYDALEEFSFIEFPAPQVAVGNQYQKRTAQFYLNRASRARKKANDYLAEADKHASLLPDISLRDRIKTVINGCIGSLAVSNPKEKFLVISLAVLTDLAGIGIDAIDKYFELRKSLTMAAAELEEFNYYSRLALASPLYVEIENFCYLMEELCPMMEEALQWLILADMHTTTLQMKCGSIVSSYISQARDIFIRDIEKHGHPTIRHSDNMVFLLENLDEIFTLCGKKDQYFKEVAKGLIIECYKTFKEIEKQLILADKIDHTEEEELFYENYSNKGYYYDYYLLKG